MLQYFHYAVPQQYQAFELKKATMNVHGNALPRNVFRSTLLPDRETRHHGISLAANYGSVHAANVEIIIGQEFRIPKPTSNNSLQVSKSVHRC